jgi:hypothetical protein
LSRARRAPFAYRPGGEGDKAKTGAVAVTVLGSGMCGALGGRDAGAFRGTRDLVILQIIKNNIFTMIFFFASGREFE